MKKRTPIFGIACLLAMTTALLAGCGCSDSTATPDEAVDTSIQTVTEIVTDDEGNTYIEEATKVIDLKTDNKSYEKSEKSEKSESNDKKDTSSNKSESSSSDKTNNSSKNNNSSSSKNDSSSSNKNTSSNKNNSSSSDKNTSTNNSSNSTSKNEEPKHTHSWVNMTKQVKVIDQEAYTYEEPVYETQWRTICNACGADITENRVEHSKNHALTDGGGGYHNEPQQIQVGTQTVEVPEKSHYETEIIGRKCNSCGENEYY